VVVIVLLFSEFVVPILLLLLSLHSICFDFYLDVAEVGNLGDHAISDFLILVNKLGERNDSKETWTSQLQHSCNRND